jgi:hypothetical protein
MSKKTHGAAAEVMIVMPCPACDNTGWVCEEHPDRPWRGTSRRADACDCVKVGMPCEACNPSGGIDKPPAISPIARVTFDNPKLGAALSRPIVIPRVVLPIPD